MRYDININSSKFWVSKDELYIMSSSVIEFSQEMHWKLDACKNKDNFIGEFREQFDFSLIELDYIMQELWELEVNFRKINISEIFILLFKDIPHKPRIIYTALSECSKNYEDYEISTRTGTSKEELDAVLKEFKEKVMDKLAVDALKR